MVSFRNNLAISLAACNVASAAINICAVVAYGLYFGLQAIGGLAVVLSASALLMPLVMFRLDLAFHRLDAVDRPGLTAVLQVWAGAFAFLTGLVLLLFHTVFDWQSIVFVLAVPLHLMFSAAASAAWAEKVCDRNLRDVFILQVVRALFASVLPFAFSFALEDGLALIFGQTAAQLVFLLFLPARRFFHPRALIARVQWVVGSTRDLLIDNVLPVLVNTASLHITPLLAAAIFGIEASAVLWLIFRLFLAPASMIAEPVRRDVYAGFTDGRTMVRNPGRMILRYKAGVVAFCLLLLVGLMVMAGLPNLRSLFGDLGSMPGVLALGVAWAMAILFNAPNTGLIPVLRVAWLQTGVELIGLAARVGALLLGLLGVGFQSAVLVFLGLTVAINLLWGVILDVTIWRRCRGLVPTPPTGIRPHDAK